MCSTIEKIRKVSCELENLDEKKCKAVENVYCCMKEIAEVNKAIEKAERELQAALGDNVANACRDRIRAEIDRIKKDKKKAEKIFCVYDKQLEKACKHYKRCAEGNIC